MHLFGLLFVSVLYFLTISTLVTGDCSVYSQKRAKIRQCRQVQECFDKSLLSNSDNLYVLGKAFRSTQPRPGIAVIINYYIMYTVNNFAILPPTKDTADEDYDADYMNMTEFEEYSNVSTVQSTDIPASRQTFYVQQIGWSSSGVYTQIRPAVLLAFQPAWLLWTLSFGIDNYGYPKTINLHLNITECDLPGYRDAKEALEYLTAKLDYNATAKLAYAWNPRDPLLFGEVVIFTIAVIFFALFLILLIIIFPKLKPIQDCAAAGLSFQLLYITQMEMDYQSKLIRALNVDTHSIIRHTIRLVTLAIGIVFGIAMIIAGVKRKWSCRKTIAAVAIFSSSCMLVLCLVIYSIPLVIFTTIYPVEMISTVSFVIATITGIIMGTLVLKWFARKNSKSDKPSPYYYYGCSTIIFIVSYIAAPITFQLLLIMYLSLLKSLSESPISQFFQLILSFVPSITATIAGILLTKKLRSTQTEKMDTPSKSQHSLCSISSSSTGGSSTTTTPGRNQPASLRSRNNETSLPTQV